jgi:hypothetical protein
VRRIPTMARYCRLCARPPGGHTSIGLRVLAFPGFSLMSGSTWWKRREIEHGIPVSRHTQQVATSTRRAGGEDGHPHLLYTQPSLSLNRKRSTCSGVSACSSTLLAAKVVCLMHQKSRLVCSVRFGLEKVFGQQRHNGFVDRKLGDEEG